MELLFKSLPDRMNSTSSVTEKKSAALSSVAAALFLTGIKLIVGLQTNSLGILSEAAHSALDLVAALMTYAAVSLADKPPDRDHLYGHGKIENLSAFAETILLVITCAWIIYEAAHRLISHEVHIEANVWAFAVMGIAIIVDTGRSRVLAAIARKHHSQALEADALHFSSDIWTSAVVILGLISVSLGYPMVDAVAAIVVAILVLFVSYRLGRKTVDALMDRVPQGLYEKMLDAIARVHGVEEIRSIRLRPSGAKVFVDTTVAIRRTIPFERAHAIMDQVERAIHVVHPHADVVVHAEPFTSPDETIVDKVRMIVLQKGLRAPHNLEVHNVDGRYFIDFDIEYQKGKSFIEAHDVADEIEEAIRHEVGSVDRVTIHMEEYQPDEGRFSNVSEAERALCDAISQAVQLDERVRDCSAVTLLKFGDAYILSLTCRVDKALTLDQVHAIIADIESALYRQFKQLRRITIHAEPA
ncbi:MAG TPA: cation diffusion facilitator family transporter [Bacteroidota bacterium]|nr:cation diffusion facilitator family transporter [Bacteroidota bacterium]